MPFRCLRSCLAVLVCAVALFTPYAVRAQVIQRGFPPPAFRIPGRGAPGLPPLGGGAPASPLVGEYLPNLPTGQRTDTIGPVGGPGPGQRLPLPPVSGPAVEGGGGLSGPGLPGGPQTLQLPGQPLVGPLRLPGIPGSAPAFGEPMPQGRGLVLPGQSLGNQSFFAPGTPVDETCYYVAAEEDAQPPFVGTTMTGVLDMSYQALRNQFNSDGSAPFRHQGWAGLYYEMNLFNLLLMANGSPPLDKFFGKPVELHHDGQRQGSPLVELPRHIHRGPIGYQYHHPNTGSQPSNINRPLFRAQREQYWRARARQLYQMLISGQPRRDRQH